MAKQDNEELKKGNYDDLMAAAKAKLEFEKNGTINQDIYAEMREEEDEDSGDENKTLPNVDNVDYYKNLDLDEDEPNYEKEEYYIDSNDTPIFEDGPGLSKVEVWKKEYGENRVFHVKIINKDFVFRTLNRAEYEQIASKELDSLTNEEVICKTCVLWPMNYNYTLMGQDSAGYPSTLAQIIMENSGFTTEYGIEVL